MASSSHYLRQLRPVLVLLPLLLAAGCGLLPEKIDETRDWSAGKLYSEAKSSLSDGNYQDAISYYEKLEARFPFGRYAQQAQLEMAYAYYKSDEPASATATLDRFIKLYPRHPDLDYAYYLKGLVNFNQGMGLVERYLPTDRSQRDPGAARTSFQDFAELLRRFPNGKYAADAHQRMIYLRNNLAAYEVHVADYYMRRGAYLAAANRAAYVVEHYQQTPAVPDALGVMAKAYQRMGLTKLSDDALRVLEKNYPNHPDIAKVRKLAAQ